MTYVTFGAPVPPGTNYDSKATKTFGPPEFVESIFTRDFGANIPQNYLHLFKEKLIKMQDDVRTPRSVDYFQYTCPIMRFAILIDSTSNVLALSSILVRPCAEGHGFYRELLWSMRTIVVNFNFNKLLIANIYPTNIEIVKQMGFDIHYDKIREKYDAYLAKDACIHKKRAEWAVPDTYPTSDQLNDPVYHQTRHDISDVIRRVKNLALYHKLPQCIFQNLFFLE